MHSFVSPLPSNRRFHVRWAALLYFVSRGLGVALVVVGPLAYWSFGIVDWRVYIVALSVIILVLIAAQFVGRPLRCAACGQPLLRHAKQPKHPYAGKMLGISVRAKVAWDILTQSQHHCMYCHTSYRNTLQGNLFIKPMAAASIHLEAGLSAPPIFSEKAEPIQTLSGPQVRHSIFAAALLSPEIARPPSLPPDPARIAPTPRQSVNRPDAPSIVAVPVTASAPSPHHSMPFASPFTALFASPEAVPYSDSESKAQPTTIPADPNLTFSPFSIAVKPPFSEVPSPIFSGSTEVSPRSGSPFLALAPLSITELPSPLTLDHPMTPSPPPLPAFPFSSAIVSGPVAVATPSLFTATVPTALFNPLLKASGAVEEVSLVLPIASLTPPAPPAPPAELTPYPFFQTAKPAVPAAISRFTTAPHVLPEMTPAPLAVPISAPTVLPVSLDKSLSLVSAPSEIPALIPPVVQARLSVPTSFTMPSSAPVSAQKLPLVPTMDAVVEILQQGRLTMDSAFLAMIEQLRAAFPASLSSSVTSPVPAPAIIGHSYSEILSVKTQGVALPSLLSIPKAESAVISELKPTGLPMQAMTIEQAETQPVQVAPPLSLLPQLVTSVADPIAFNPFAEFSEEASLVPEVPSAPVSVSAPRHVSAPLTPVTEPVPRLFSMPPAAKLDIPLPIPVASMLSPTFPSAASNAVVPPALPPLVHTASPVALPPPLEPVVTIHNTSIPSRRRPLPAMQASLMAELGSTLQQAFSPAVSAAESTQPVVAANVAPVMTHQGLPFPSLPVAIDIPSSHSPVRSASLPVFPLPPLAVPAGNSFAPIPGAAFSAPLPLAEGDSYLDVPAPIPAPFSFLQPVAIAPPAWLSDDLTNLPDAADSPPMWTRTSIKPSLS